MGRRSHDIDAAGLHEELVARGLNTKLKDIDTVLWIADECGLWTKEFLANAETQAKKARLRRLFRDGYINEDGNRVREWNIEEVDPETGEVRRGYKELSFFTLDNYEVAIREARDRVNADLRALRLLCREAAAVFGRREVQARFDFVLPFPKKKADEGEPMLI
jgi:hypothetical protein